MFSNLFSLYEHHDYLRKKIGKADFFFVGGCIRDALLGVKTTLDDLDITMVGQPGEIFSRVDNTDISLFKTDKFGTMTIIPHERKERKYEITPFRTEGVYHDLRHPDEVHWTDDLIADSQRRDFTINALYAIVVDVPSLDNTVGKGVNEEDILSSFLKHSDKNGFAVSSEGILIIQKHELIHRLFPRGILDHEELKKILTQEKIITTISLILLDPQKGFNDLIERRLRAVGSPDQRLREDPLRILRALRIINILNQKLPHSFDFETQTRRSLKKNYYLISKLPKERVREEIVKVFKENNPFGYISLLDEINVLKYIFPALYATKGVHQPVRFHPFDVYAHTLLTLYNLQQFNDDYLVKLAMLYHDVGKTEQYYYYSIGLNEDERKEAHGLWVNHVQCGVDFVHHDFTKLGFSNKEIDEVARYVKRHMFPGEIVKGKHQNQAKKIKELLSEAGMEKLHNLLDITRADRLGQMNSLQKPGLADIDALDEMAKKIYENEGRFIMKNLAVDGNDLMAHFQLSPGPKVKKLLLQAFDRVLEDVKTRNEKEIILSHLRTFCGNDKKYKRK